MSDRRIMTPEKFRARLANEIRDAGQELIDNAEGYVGNIEMLSDIKITISFDISGMEFSPTIRVDKEYLCKRTYERVKGELK